MPMAPPLTMPPPDITVVIPTRDRRELLPLTLRNALDQRGVELEVVVVDDGSTTSVADLIQEANDDRLHLLRNATPLGVSRARNQGIEIAQGEWVALLDDDDLWAPDKLHLQLDAIRKANATWAYTGAVAINTSHRIQGGSPPLPPRELMRVLARWNPMPGGCSNVMASRAVLDAVGLFDPRLNVLADWDQWLRLAATGSPTWVDKPLIGYRLHPSNMSLEGRRTIAELGLLQRKHPAIEIDRALFYRHLGRLCVRSSRPAEAMSYFARAVTEARSKQSLGTFVRDALTLVDRGVESLRLGVGLTQPARRKALHPNDPNRAWKAEAQRWLVHWQLVDKESRGSVAE
jgi:glycosyltransferase involved in cell wall biosynthesis